MSLATEENVEGKSRFSINRSAAYLTANYSSCFLYTWATAATHLFCFFSFLIHFFWILKVGRNYKTQFCIRKELGKIGRHYEAFTGYHRKLLSPKRPHLTDASEDRPLLDTTETGCWWGNSEKITVLFWSMNFTSYVFSKK